jgi:hypothetical protein
MQISRAFGAHAPWRSVAVLAALTFVMAAPPSSAWADDAQFDDPYYCSDWYATHPSNSLSPDKQRRCLIAIASTYLDAEEGSITPEEVLFADDVIRYTVGSAPSANNDSAAEIRAAIPASADIIASIANRRWTADTTNGTAFVIYDGFLIFGDGVNPDFYVSERLTVVNGLITEIAIGGVQFP